MTPKVTVVTPCYNEAGNVEALAEAVRAVFRDLEGRYEFEHLFIDNASTDGTQAVLRRMAAADPRVLVILNARNFGHIRSPYHGLIQATGDAVIAMAADFQEPPELIPEFLKRWEAGHRVVAAVKTNSEESAPVYWARSAYYALAARVANVRLIPHFTGFGLYDRSVVEVLRGIDDPYPYLRGLVAELGEEPARVPFVQPLRKEGKSKSDLATLYDMAMLGITTHSKVPLRLAALSGFALSALCFLVAGGYLAYKLLYWNQFSVGVAPLVIGFFFVAAIQLLFIGILGEYLGNIQTQVLKRPRVVERERINC